MQHSYQPRIECNLRIPMRDGIELSADLVRPDADGAFPIIVEYHPYRKDDVSRAGFDAHWYFAERGFIGLRLDARGTGSSAGVNTDEYRPIEQRDGYDAIEWLAEQPFSNGQLGMFGSSYGGFTAIQVAMQKPPHLKAIVPLFATDDRYADDCHYSRGGNMRMYYDVGAYGGSMVAMNALPPLPEHVGPGWAELWKARLSANEPYLLQWIKHQLDGDYWQRASLRPEYDRLQCPTFHIAGWHDGYVNAQLRTFVNATHIPHKILIGPWVHQRPNLSTPGPRIDYLHEVCRFFAYWLRGEDTGIMDEPRLTVYMQRHAPPQRAAQVIPGDWRAVAGFPPDGAGSLTLYLREAGELGPAPAGESTRCDEFQYDPTVGSANRLWSAGGMSYYLAEDQRADEAQSLTFTSRPSEHDVHLLGWPRVVLHASSSAQVATFTAKLAAVAPDGSSALISDGSLNGTRRKSLTQPEPMTPGEIYELEIPMAPTGWVLAAGHRLRLAIASADFPNLWPTPASAVNRVYRAAELPSRLVLPVVPADSNSAPEFRPAPRLHAVVKHRGEPPIQQLVRDQIDHSLTLVNRRGGTVSLDNGQGELYGSNEFRCMATPEDPARATNTGRHTFVLRRPEGEFKIVAESTIRATAAAFHLLINLNVLHNGLPFFHKTWTVSEPRKWL